MNKAQGQTCAAFSEISADPDNRIGAFYFTAMTKIRFTINKTAATATGSSLLRNEKRDGRDYLVAPVVAVQEQVLNGLLTTADEIAPTTEQWNGVPLLLGHAFDDDEPISAQTPGIWEEQGLGVLLNAEWKEPKLKGEMWFDMGKVAQVGDEATSAMTRLQNGEVMEVSTAYAADVIEEEGEFNGQAYYGRVVNLQPDHLALLPNEVGACSVKDGCGVPRLNVMCTNCVQHACPCKQADTAVQPDAPTEPEQTFANAATREGVMVALFVPTDVAETLALSDADLPDGATAVAPADMHVTLCYLGKADEAAFDQNKLLETVQEFARYAIGAIAVQGEIGGIGRFVSPGEDQPDAFYASLDSQTIHGVRTRLVDFLHAYGIYPATNHAFTPHITLAYVPADAPTPAFLPQRQPIAFPLISVAWRGQITHFQLQGMVETAVANKETAMELEEKVEEITEETVVNDETGGDAIAPATTPVAPAPAVDITQLVETAVAKVLEPYQSLLATLQTNAKKEREQVINGLLQVKGMAFSREELGAFTDLQLNRMAQTLVVPNYAGQVAAPTAVEDEWEDA